MFQDAEGSTSISKQIPIPVLAQDRTGIVEQTAKELVAILRENSLTSSNEENEWK